MRVTSFLLTLSFLGSTAARAQAPAGHSWRDEVQRPGAGSSRLAKRFRAATRISRLASLANPVAESEPNDSVAQATSLALGDQGTGTIGVPGDVDTWAVDLTAGQFFSVDVDANQVGSPLDPALALIAPNGRTFLAFNDDFDGLDSRISFRIQESGRYFVQVRAFGGLIGNPDLRYAVNFGTVNCAAVGTEREPNGTAANATPLALGGTGSGELCSQDQNPLGDVDYWAFTVQAGTTVELDVDAASLNPVVDPFLSLYGSDGTTLLAFNDDTDGSDSRLQFTFATAGTYFAAVSSVSDPGGNPFPYQLHLRTIAGGPGDPITLRASNLGRPVGLVAGQNGDLYTGDLIGSRILRITAQGTVTTFASGIDEPEGLAFDASGNLLVASLLGTVYRITPQGEVTPFITDAAAPFWIAVAPDGRIWLTNIADRSLRRYSAAGRFETRFDLTGIGGFGPGPLAIGPTGEPFVSNGNEIWKLVNGQPQRVLSDQAVLWVFAFDNAGNIYAPAPSAGVIKLFDASGRALANPFAVSPDAPQALAFGRDQNGATVARLFATDPLTGRVIEMNPQGIAHPGLPLGFVQPGFTLDAAVAGLLGGEGLSPADAQLLDALGNHNGRYDVGDLQSYLATVGNLPATPNSGRAKLKGSSR